MSYRVGSDEIMQSGLWLFSTAALRILEVNVNGFKFL